MQAKLTVKMDGQAFTYGAHFELSRILYDLGNRVGTTGCYVGDKFPVVSQGEDIGVLEIIDD